MAGISLILYAFSSHRKRAKESKLDQVSYTLIRLIERHPREAGQPGTNIEQLHGEHEHISPGYSHH